MKVNIKTIKDEKFVVEVPENATVLIPYCNFEDLLFSDALVRSASSRG